MICHLVFPVGNIKCFFDNYLGLIFLSLGNTHTWKSVTGSVADSFAFLVLNTQSGTHNLNIPGFDNTLTTGTVFVFKCTGKWNGNNLHIVMWMRRKRSSAGNEVIIQYP